MSHPSQNQQVRQSSITPKSNPSKTKTKKPARPSEPDAFAGLAEAVVSAQAYLNNPKAEKTSTRREPVRLVPEDLPRASSELRCGSGLEPRQEARIEGASSLPQAAVDEPARSAVRSVRAASHRPRVSRVSTVRQAKHYLRVSRSPEFLRSAPNLQRHRRKCAICRHEEREMIEELFIHWHSPQAIANFFRDYDNVNWVSIYRHAYALGLDQIRRRNLRHFFENLLDDAINAAPTFAGVLGAARALGCVTEDGRWVEPEKRIVMTTVVRKEEPASTTSIDPALSSSEDRSASFAFSRECKTGPPGSRPGESGGSGGRCSTSTSPRASLRGCSVGEESATAPATLLPQAAFDARARSAEQFGSPATAGEPQLAPSTLLPQAAFAQPAAASQTPPPSGQPGAARRKESVAPSATTLPEGALNEPAAGKRTPPPGSSGAVRSSTREIRLPLNSHKPKHKPISNR